MGLGGAVHWETACTNTDNHCKKTLNSLLNFFASSKPIVFALNLFLEQGDLGIFLN